MLKVDTAFGEVTVCEFGSPDGTPLVCLHSLALSGDMYARAATWSGPVSRRVLAPDLPPKDSSDLNGLQISDLSTAAAAVIEVLGLGPVDVVGMSMGGCVAQQLTLDRPALVQRLVLADTCSDYGPDRARNWEHRARSVETTARRDLLDTQLHRWFSDDFRADEPGECARIADIFAATSPQVHAACCRALGAFNTTPRLDEISVPTLVLVGEQDYATPPAMAQILADGVRESTLEILTGVRHFSLIQSQVAWKLIEAHLAE